MKKMVLALGLALVLQIGGAARAEPGNIVTGITASSTDTYRDWERPGFAVDPDGLLNPDWPHLVGGHPNEEHQLSHNCEGQFRNYPPDPTPTMFWLKLDLGANYILDQLRVWNGIFGRVDGNGGSGMNQADLYYSSSVADPGDDSTVNWTPIGTPGTRTFNKVTAANPTGGTFPVSDEIALDNIDARWFAIKANSNHGHPNFTGVAEVQFIEGERPRGGTVIVIR